MRNLGRRFLWICPLFMLLGSAGSAENDAAKSQAENATVISKSVTNLDRYRNVSSGPSLLLLQFKDSSGEIVKGSFSTEETFRFLKQEGMITSVDDFVKYMQSHENGPLPIDVEEFKLFLGKSLLTKVPSLNRKYHRKEPLNDRYKDMGSKIFNGSLYAKPLTFSDLGVANESEMLMKYFSFNYKWGSGFYKNSKAIDMPAFIAFLIGLGYDVYLDDYSGILAIRTNPIPYDRVYKSPNK